MKNYIVNIAGDESLNFDTKIIVFVVDMWYHKFGLEFASIYWYEFVWYEFVANIGFTKHEANNLQVLYGDDAKQMYYGANMTLMARLRQIFIKIAGQIIDIKNKIIDCPGINKMLWILRVISILIANAIIVKSMINMCNWLFAWRTKILLLKLILAFAYGWVMFYVIVFVLGAICLLVLWPKINVHLCTKTIDRDVSFLLAVNNTLETNGNLDGQEKQQLIERMRALRTNIKELANQIVETGKMAIQDMIMVGVIALVMINQYHHFCNISILNWFLSVLLPYMLIGGYFAIHRLLTRYRCRHKMTFEVMGFLTLVYSWLFVNSVSKLPTISVAGILKNFSACSMLILLLISCCFSIVILATGCKLNLMGDVVRLSDHDNPFTDKITWVENMVKSRLPRPWLVQFPVLKGEEMFCALGLEERPGYSFSQMHG